MLTPGIAVIGDVLMALLLAAILILPARVLWRKLTRPIERKAWSRLLKLSEKGDELTLGERSLESWLSGRVRFAAHMNEMRHSLKNAFLRLLRIGLPMAAVLVSINSIWGFSWYFNSENWTSVFWQEVTKHRVNLWRESGVKAVRALPSSRGIDKNDLFSITPEGNQ